ncbi:MAG: hypothetical protein Q3993_06225 [Filifactor alocis]|nr:hypothetical protein [Filifactor alocis]
MTIISYIIVFLVICVVGFIIRRLWVGLIDLIISLFKKLFFQNSGKNETKWHSMEEIKSKNKK